jgi:hypothetical protein
VTRSSVRCLALASATRVVGCPTIAPATLTRG